MSMDRKKSKYLSETKFWAFGSLKAEKTRGAIMAPPQCGYVIPDPMWNRVKETRVYVFFRNFCHELRRFVVLGKCVLNVILF